MEEMSSRETYLNDTYTPFYVCSYAAHCFNLLNVKKQIYWEGKDVPNMRLHIVFIAPPGFMKSYYINNMGGSSHSGIFTNAKIKIGMEQEQTAAGLVGTFIPSSKGDVPIETEGSAKTYSEGIMMIDELSALTDATKSTYNNQMTTQILALLDHGKMRKRLGSGYIEYDSNATVWGGVQPARYDFTQGVGRRVEFLLFLPTKQDNANLRAIKERKRNIRVNPVCMSRLWNRIDTWIDDMERIKSLEFDDTVARIYNKLDVYSYDTQLMDRLIVGYHLATYGPDENMVVGVHDKRLVEMINKEKRWRDDIHRGIPIVQLERMILMGGSVQDGNSVMSRKQLVDDCLMFGWNPTQVTELLGEMIKSSRITVKGGNIIMERNGNAQN